MSLGVFTKFFAKVAGATPKTTTADLDASSPYEPEEIRVTNSRNLLPQETELSLEDGAKKLLQEFRDTVMQDGLNVNLVEELYNLASGERLDEQVRNEIIDTFLELLTNDSCFARMKQACVDPLKRLAPYLNQDQKKLLSGQVNKADPRKDLRLVCKNILVQLSRYSQGQGFILKDNYDASLIDVGPKEARLIHSLPSHKKPILPKLLEQIMHEHREIEGLCFIDGINLNFYDPDKFIDNIFERISNLNLNVDLDKFVDVDSDGESFKSMDAFTSLTSSVIHDFVQSYDRAFDFYYMNVHKNPPDAPGDLDTFILNHYAPDRGVRLSRDIIGMAREEFRSFDSRSAAKEILELANS